MTPEERLERQAAAARRGLELVRADAGLREQTLRWLEQHPSGLADADAAWRQCLEGTGPLAAWLERGASREEWSQALPLRVLLSSHPFPDLNLWLTIRR